MLPFFIFFIEVRVWVFRICMLLLNSFTEKWGLEKWVYLRDSSMIRERFAWELSTQPNTARIPHMAAANEYTKGRRERHKHYGKTKQNKMWIRMNELVFNNLFTHFYEVSFFFVINSHTLSEDSRIIL